ncbi:MAG TPA: homoserine O-acetyltransferase [Bacteroidales bacterium]|nr:homoserine O-acetyltransferase [Bacteroidales bacterium]HRR17249.1 homoserine O-acetyltransferase [Bacteroidales bacterium]
MKILIHREPFTTETGYTFSGLEIAYDTWGKLNEGADNVIWVCHALTANSDVTAWWPGMVGEGLAFDTKKYFTVCVNILGSCYGTTGPLSINPATGEPWFNDFPLITVRDLVMVHEIVRKHLGIKQIHTIIGASIGGYQALEYSIMFPDLIKNLVFIASSARQSPWAIAFNESQRLAIEADPTFYSRNPEGGKKGLRAARSIGLLSYRTPYAYNTTQAETDDEKITSFKASSYQDYQGDKLVKRFNVWSYYRLTQLSDSHNIGRSRGGVIKALSAVKAKTLCIGIKSDLLYPVNEQKFVAENVPDGRYEEIDSFYGHDGFLIETKQVSDLLKKFWQ